MSRPDDARKREHAALPVEVQTFMPIGEWLYKTRREAEDVLAKALADRVKYDARAAT